MSDAKTTAHNADVGAFLATVKDPQRRADAQTVVSLLRQITGAPAVMWGTAIIGFGSRHYRYDSGREGDTMIIGLSPRAAALTLYGLGIAGGEPLLVKLGRHTTGKGCLYLKNLSEVNLPVLTQLIEQAWTRSKEL